jgi:cytidylate kinase
LIKKKKFITVAIDSPAAAGAGTQAKLISKHYNLFYLDTGKIYRYIGLLKLHNKNKFSYKLIKRKIGAIKFDKLKNKRLLSNDVAISASEIAKDKKIREIVHKFQQKCAYHPPKSELGSREDLTPKKFKSLAEKFVKLGAKIIGGCCEITPRHIKELKNINL